MIPVEPVGGGQWRELARQALARLLRSHGSAQFDLCEDAVQEALLQAYQQWPARFPDDPLGWLIATARRRYADRARSDARRRHREARAASLQAPVMPEAVHRDDSLLVLQLCCHPDLPRSGQVALTLRAVAGHHPGLPRIDSVRAHLLERAGRTADAAGAYQRAIAGTVSLAEQRHLRRRLRHLSGAHV